MAEKNKIEITARRARVFLAVQDHAGGDHFFELFGVFSTRERAEAEVLSRYNKWERLCPGGVEVAKYSDISEFNREEWRVDEEVVQ